MSNTISAQGWSPTSNGSVFSTKMYACYGIVPAISGKVEQVNLAISLSTGLPNDIGYTNVDKSFVFFKDKSNFSKYTSSWIYKVNGNTGEDDFAFSQALSPLTSQEALKKIGWSGRGTKNKIIFTRNELTELGKDASNWAGETLLTIGGGYSTASYPFFTGPLATLTIYYSPNNIKYGVNGEWVECVPYYGVNGEWRQVEVSLGLNNEWVR